MKHKPCRTPVDLFRPSTSLMLFGFQDVDARDKHGHDESIRQGRWYEAFLHASRCPTSRNRYKLAAMWIAAKAPSLAEMEAMAHDIFDRLPAAFRAQCEGVVLRVDDFPADDVLDELNADSEFDLLGLFQGVGLPFRSEQDVTRMPNMIWLYRRPILDYWAEHDETLGQIVRHVLIHEIGHHFGLSDRDMATIEAAAE